MRRLGFFFFKGFASPPSLSKEDKKKAKRMACTAKNKTNAEESDYYANQLKIKMQDLRWIVVQPQLLGSPSWHNGEQTQATNPRSERSISNVSSSVAHLAGELLF